jgi:sugar lactone lactonase YvrE
MQLPLAQPHLRVNVAAPYPPGVTPTILLDVIGATAPDFTLSASPVSGFVQEGSNIGTTISTSVANGFNSAIAFSASGQPAGAIVNFSASSIAAPGAGSTSMTVSVPLSVAPGNYPMTVIGTGGGINQGTSFLMIVTAAPPDFTVTASPTSVAAQQGGSSVSTINTVALDSLSSGIILSATGQPAGVTVGFSPGSIAPPGNGASTMTLTAASSVTPGVYPITVTGTSGGVGESTTVSLIVESVQDFGQVQIGTKSAAMPILLVFSASGKLGSTTVLTQGVTGLDFALASGGTCTANTTYNAGQACTVNLAFTPEFAGSRYGSVVLTDANHNILATGYAQGTGVGPQINFLPNTESTIASTGLYDPNGVAVDGRGNVYIADSANNRILKETLSRNNFAQSVIPTSPLNYPYGIAVDAGGNIYVADTNNFRVLKESPSDGSYVESVVAGFSPNDSVFPMGVAVDGKGNVYFSCSSGALYIETLAAGSYTQSTAPTGTSSLAGLAVDEGGNIYLADNANVAILKETPSGGGYILSTLPISGIGVPAGIALDGRGDIFISDFANQIWEEIPAGNGYMQSSIATSALDLPFGLAVDGPGNLYIADASNFRVLKEEFANPPSLTFASTGIGSTSSDSPQIISVENVGNAALAFPVPSRGTNPTITANFTLNSSGESACPLVSAHASQPGTLAAGASCLLPVSFSPAALGSLSGVLSLSDNNLSAAAPNYAIQNIALSGRSIQNIPVITWNAPTAVTYGTRLSALQLNATSSVAGTFTYSPKIGTLLTAGSQALTVTFTPKNSTDYATASASVTLSVNQATPTIKWTTPAPITHGVALSGEQLDATSSVTGTFTYSPIAGTVLGVGSQLLSVFFTPTDITDYTTATSSVVLTVNPAPTFTLNASPGSLSVSSGASSETTITVISVNGFIGNVSLSASGLPSGVTAAFSKNPTAGTSILTLKASKEAVTGLASITIKGTSGSLTETATIELTVN